MTMWLMLALAAFTLGVLAILIKPSFFQSSRAAVSPKTYSSSTLGEVVEDDPVDRFFGGDDSIEWIAVRATPRTVTSAWEELMQVESHRKNVAGHRLEYDLDSGTRWLVYRYTSSDWTHVKLIQGTDSLSDRLLRELSLRTASDVLLTYGRNDFDKARALVCIRYHSGTPEEALLIGEDDDQDLMLDYLGLDEGDLDLDFEFDFDLGRDLTVAFLAEHGVEPRDVSGKLERMDLMIERRRR